jgi:hypothetical protein
VIMKVKDCECGVDKLRDIKPPLLRAADGKVYIRSDLIVKEVKFAVNNSKYLAPSCLTIFQTS